MKRRIFIWLMISCINTYGQVDTIKYGGFDFVFTPIDTTLKFIEIDKLPEFKGGFGELVRFVGKTITYPENAINDSIQGKVVVAFVVLKNGDVQDENILKGLYPDIDNECLKMLLSMPPWSPGEIDSKPIDYRITFSIHFKLWD